VVTWRISEHSSFHVVEAAQPVPRDGLKPPPVSIVVKLGKKVLLLLNICVALTVMIFLAGHIGVFSIGVGGWLCLCFCPRDRVLLVVLSHLKPVLASHTYVYRRAGLPHLVV
jgi:hypothetical protein